MKKPLMTEYAQAPYVSNYIDLVDSENVIETLRQQAETVKNLYKSLSADQQEYRYAPRKWSVREILGHMVDTERVFVYRALCFARGEQKPLPGFDENEYFANANYGAQSLEQLLNQYTYVRLGTIALGESLPEEAQLRMGTASGNSLSARALFSMIAGHERHHLNVLADRYSIKSNP